VHLGKDIRVTTSASIACVYIAATACRASSHNELCGSQDVLGWIGSARNCTAGEEDKAEHQTDHPSVKPVTLIEDICSLICPRGGRILDAIAGTGTTGIAARRQALCDMIEDRLRREA